MAVLYVGNREVSASNPIPIQSAIDSIRNITPFGYAQLPIGTGSVVTPEIPEGATIAQVKPENGGIRYIDTIEANDPTPTFGFPIEDGETLIYDAIMTDIRMIGMVDGVILNILFYGPVQNA